MTNLRLDIAQLEQAIASLLVKFPDLAEDDLLRADMFEAETELHGVLAALVSRERDAKAMAGAIKERIGDMTARKARYERQQEAWRTLIQQLMDHAGQQKLALPEATLSISHRGPEPVVVDDTALPDEFVRLVRTPNKSAINDAWKEFGTVPSGVVLSNGRTVLTVRAK